MTEILSGIKLSIVESSYIERYYANGLRRMRYIARYYDPSGKFLAQGGTTIGRLSALYCARKNLYDRYGSYANDYLNL